MRIGTRAFVGVWVGLSACAAGAMPVLVSPLGDSITQGTGVPGGYRGKLAANLTAAGVFFQFVGSRNDNPSPALTLAGQTAHDGYPEIRIGQLAAAGAWKSQTPDIVLLHIGSNDILQNQDPLGNPFTESDAQFADHMATQLTSLVGQIRTDLPNAHIMVAGIVPVNFTPQMLNRTKLYNAAVQLTVVPSFAASGRVHFVDQYASFVDAGGTPILALQPDTVHPNFDGYGTMADNWSAAIAAVPEPASLGAVVLGFTLLGRRRR